MFKLERITMSAMSYARENAPQQVSEKIVTVDVGSLLSCSYFFFQFESYALDNFSYP